MKRTWTSIAVATLLVLGLSSAYVPTAKSANEKRHYCHNGHFICSDEDNVIRAHETHVTNGRNCTFEGICFSGGIH